MARHFHERSPRVQLIIFALLCVSVITAAWPMVLGPAIRDLATREARITILRGEVTRLHAKTANLWAFEHDVKSLEASLRQATVVLPDEKDPQDVLRSLHELASDASLDLSSFTPKALVAGTQYSEWPVELGLQGGFHGLGRFFDRLGSMPRLMSVADVHIKANAQSGSKSTITATCVVTTFVFKKDSLQPRPATLVRATAPGGMR